MEIRFATKKLKKSLSTEAGRVSAYGAPIAKKVHLRLNQLTAAPHLAVMRTLSGRCHELHGNRDGQLAIDVTANLRLIFEPTDDPPPIKPDGGLDWDQVTSITLMEVADYHGD